MRKLFLILCFPVALNAQSQQATIDSLRADVAFLKSITGFDRWKVRAIPCDSLNAKRPAEFPNGEYDLAFRNRQFGCALDPVAANLDTLRGRFEGEIVKLGAIENDVAALKAKVASGVPNTSVGNLNLNTLVVDRVRVTGKLCIGDKDCDDTWQAQLQVRSNGNALAGYESNMAGNNPQSPRAHIAQEGLSGDGGFRYQQNCKLSYSGYACNVDPCREATNVGLDSRGSWSFQRISVPENADPFTGANCGPLPHENTQDFVLSTDEGARRTTILFWRPNWSIAFRCSSQIYYADISCPVQIQPQQ